MPDPTPLQARLTRLTALRDHLTTLEGHAESPDGLIKVTSTPEDPLHHLHLHPRALNLPNTDLATAIQETAAAARQDLKRHTDEALATFLAPDDPARLIADPSAAKARLQELSETARTVGADSTAAFERLRQQFGQ